jgi:DNA-binding GntR family transcriptional regulator
MELSKSFVIENYQRKEGKKMTKQTMLANELEREIMAGAYGWEGGLPNLADIAQRWNMSINTVKASLAGLEGKGVIEKRGGGYYVARIPTPMTQYLPPAHVRQSEGFCKNLGTVKTVTLPDHLLEKLSVSQHAATYRVQISGENIEGVEKPLQISYRYHVLPLTEDKVQRMQDDPTYDPMWQDTAVPAELLSHDEVMTRLATEGERDLLSLPEDTPIMHVFETIKDRNGSLLMVQEVILTPRSTLIFDYPFTNRP